MPQPGTKPATQAYAGNPGDGESRSPFTLQDDAQATEPKPVRAMTLFFKHMAPKMQGLPGP